MKCPACSYPLIIVEFSEIELDCCQNCGGVWFDDGELDLLLENAGKGDLEAGLFSGRSNSAGGDGGKKRRCPVCRRKMKMTEQNEVVIDYCSGDGLWFDKGELAALLSGSFPDAEPAALQVFSHLAEVFGEET